MAPAEIADACSRVSVGNGLPEDGHLVRAAFQGQCVYYWKGAASELKNPLLEESESKWDVGASNLPLIAEGDPSGGKDNLKNIVLTWIGSLSEEQLPATTVWKQRDISVTGIVKQLKSTGPQLQILNGELEKVLNSKKENMLQESDIIEFLDGTDAFGKGTGQDQCCIKPVAWMLLCSQMKTYTREMGSDSCGRLRFVLLHLDASKTKNTPTEEKLVPRHRSMELLTETLREVLLAQQSAAPEAAHGFADAASAPSSSQPPGESADAARPPVKLRARLSRAMANVEGPSVKEEEPIVRVKLEEPHHPPAQPVTAGAPPSDMAVSIMDWKPTAALIFIGVQDGSSAACNKSGNPMGSSVVTKHAGKAFGACATANVASRNGLLRACPGCRG
ncbi:unnamed protein product [Prorocentrum cordatum]|uniref:Inositol-pentakisphosphate 2-kinase n=1 Tax=Prorocentrum cordatum TaxID=2364126 RepID=A0ABN9X496_9DINO|nr:unnamed protein product [Polarella glacialis]CAK0894111.1 unnamed protein product [Polarella glacialis]